MTTVKTVGEYVKTHWPAPEGKTLGQYLRALSDKHLDPTGIPDPTNALRVLYNGVNHQHVNNERSRRMKLKRAANAAASDDWKVAQKAGISIEDWRSQYAAKLASESQLSEDDFFRLQNASFDARTAEEAAKKERMAAAPEPAKESTAKLNPSYASVESDELWELKPRHLKRAYKARLAGKPDMERRYLDWAIAVNLEEMIRTDGRGSLEQARSEMEGHYRFLVKTGRFDWAGDAPEPAKPKSIREPPLAAAALQKVSDPAHDLHAHEKEMALCCTHAVAAIKCGDRDAMIGWFGRAHELHATATNNGLALQQTPREARSFVDGMFAGIQDMCEELVIQERQQPAEKAQEGASRIRILSWFEEQGSHGGTTPEAARALGMGISTVSTYCSQLVKQGLLRETGRKRGLALPGGKLQKGSAIRVWVG